MATGWTAWAWDHVTAGWAFWLAYFLVWETYALTFHPGEELTAHLRPVFLSWPVTWWLAFGLWLWIGVHLLAPRIEAALLDAVRF